MDTLWRLAWALPLVLSVGVAAVLVLRRFVVPAQPEQQTMPRMSLRESLSLSDETRVHLIEVESQSYLIVESARQTVLQSTLSRADEGARMPRVLGPSWVQRLYQVRSR